MKTYISTKAYDEDFKSHVKCGWGCGYVHIPEDHPILIKIIDSDDWTDYLTPEGCPEEITYSQWDKEQEYYVIGFDTAHSYNDSFTHNEVYVTEQANDIKSLVDNYNSYDAHAYATKQIQSVIKKYSKYLI
jgi:hypothetical protein